jgi:Mg/Co/Ni transporter MgtE
MERDSMSMFAIGIRSSASRAVSVSPLSFAEIENDPADSSQPIIRIINETLFISFVLSLLTPL